MVPELGNENAAFHGFVDDPMFRIDPAGPVSTKGGVQWFRLTDAGMRIPEDIPQEFVDSLNGL
jgi:hypothetical protein